MRCKHWKPGRYSFDRLIMHGEIVGSVGYDNGAYRGSFLHHKLKEGFKSDVEAKAAVEHFGKKLLTEMLAKLGEVVGDDR